MGWDYTQEEFDKWQLLERGGAQGDYRDGMQQKIANVIDCLKNGTSIHARNDVALLRLHLLQSTDCNEFICVVVSEV